MKYMHQFAIILMVTFIAETLNHVINLPIPASIYGLILMTLLLIFKIIKLNQVRETAKYLVSIMQLMFIPSAVAIMVSWQTLNDILVPVVVMIVVSTVLVMIVTGKVADYVIYRKGVK